MERCNFVLEFRKKQKYARCLLLEKHVNPSKFDKMKCKLVLQVFSKRVSAVFSTASLRGNVKTRSIKHRARFFETLNYLFDNFPMMRAISNFNNIRENLIDNAMNMKDWYVTSANNLKTPPCFSELQQSVNATM